MYIKLGHKAFELEASTRCVYIKVMGRDWFFSRDVL